MLHNAEDGAPGFEFADPAVRRAREPDVPALIGLFRRSYGASYPYPELSDPDWMRREIRGHVYIWLVLEEAGELIGCGALRRDACDPADRRGEMGRIVVHPDHAGRGVGGRIVAALQDAAAAVLDFAYGDARTRHRCLQALVEGVGHHPMGFLPQRFVVCGRRESLVVYGVLFGPGARLRRPSPPRLVPAAAPLAAHVLASMSLPCEVEVVDAAPYGRLDAARMPLTFRRATGAALPGMDALHAGEPGIFGRLYRTRGMDPSAFDETTYTVCRDGRGAVAGAVGFQFDAANALLRVPTLAASRDGVRRELCEAVVDEGARLNATAVELDVSAYEPRLQATLLHLGFVPVAYQPGMVLHAGERLDAVRMVRHALPRAAESLELTCAARAVHALVEASLAAVP